MIKKVNTPCKACFFAQYEGKTQVGCKLGRLDKFRAIDPELVLEAYDEDHEFFVINGRKCSTYRRCDGQWACDNGKKEGLSLRRSLSIKWGVIIPFRESNLKGLLVTARSLLGNQLPPHQVFFVCSRLKNPQKLNDELSLIIGEEIPYYTWRIVQMSKRKTNTHTKVDAAARKLDREVAFYSIFRAGDRISHTFGSKLDRLVVDELALVTGIRPTKSLGSGFTLSMSVFRHPEIRGHQPGEFEGRTVWDPFDKLTNLGVADSASVLSLEDYLSE